MSPTVPNNTPTTSASSNLVASGVTSAVDAAAQSTTNILHTSSLNYENGVWRLLLSPEIASVFTEKIRTREARGIGHEELIEILGERFLGKLAVDIRALEDTNTQVWNGRDNITMTIEILLPIGMSRQTLEVHDDTYNTGLELTKNISFKIPVVEAFSDKNLGTWGPVENSTNGQMAVEGMIIEGLIEIIQEIGNAKRALFGYITRPGGDIIVSNTGKNLTLPQFYVIEGHDLADQFTFGLMLGAEEIGLGLGRPTGSLGIITKKGGNREVTAFCYIGMIHSDEISALGENYRWISPEDFLSIEESSEPLFGDYASRVFVAEALRKGVVVGDPIFDPKK